MTVKNKSCPSLTEPKYGKPIKILVWINGDFQSLQQEVKLNPSDLRSWNRVLSFLTATLKPRFGAVRKLYHLGTRKMVECLKNIQPNEKFVAVGIEKFRIKKNAYLTDEERHQLQKSKTSRNSVKVEENVDSLLDFMDYTKKKKRTVIYVMVSGRTCQEPLKLVLTREDLKAWNMILEYLGYQLDVEEGIQHLCKINGTIVSNPERLRHGELYVAVPFNDKFVMMDYIKLFEELKPNKIIKLRKPKKIRSTVLATKKKYKSKNVDCVNIKCPGECHQLPCLTSSSVAVQTMVSGPIDNLRKENGPIDNLPNENDPIDNLPNENGPIDHLPKENVNDDSDYDRDDDGRDDDGHDDDSDGSNDDPNLDALQTYLRDSAEVSLNKFNEDVAYDSITDLVRTILDELIEACLLELEETGVITPPHLSIPRESIPLSDKVFLPDPEEKNLDLPAPEKSLDQKPSMASCCAKYVEQKTDEKEKIMTTFAELARLREMENESRRRESRTSLSTSGSDGRKSVTFLQTEQGLPHQETIYEGSESRDPDEPPRRSPKASILKFKSGDLRKSTNLPKAIVIKPRASIDNLNENQVEISSQDGSISDYDEKTHNMHERFKKSASLNRSRDSIMVTVNRLSRAMSTPKSLLATISTQKNLEDSEENDKIVQTEYRNLDYLHNQRLSDYYENVDVDDASNISLASSRYSIDKSTSKNISGMEKKRISFKKKMNGVQISNCCEKSVSQLAILKSQINSPLETKIEYEDKDHGKRSVMLKTQDENQNGKELRETSGRFTFSQNKTPTNSENMTYRVTQTNIDNLINNTTNDSTALHETYDTNGNDYKGSIHENDENPELNEPQNANELVNGNGEALDEQCIELNDCCQFKNNTSQNTYDTNSNGTKDGFSGNNETSILNKPQNIDQIVNISNNETLEENKVGLKNYDQSQNNTDNLSSTQNSDHNVSPEIQNKEYSSTLNWTCLRENCSTFACSEISLKSCQSN